MSGIVGLFFLDGRSVEPMLLQRMTDSVAHRGADNGGTWHQGGVGFGHRMLWTTSESRHEQLPCVDREKNLAITADARLDNRDELIATLGLTHRPPHEIGDGAIILEAYEHWGERCVENLLGDFAFAIWDGRRRVLFCARDHFGVRPFYYHHSHRAFVFASEIKGLLCVPEVPRRLNETRVANYVGARPADAVHTFYRDIVHLPDGGCLTVGCDRFALRKYWKLDPTCEIRMGSDAEYAESFRELLTQSVRSRLRSAYPVGSLLSGGLDSGAIVCLADKLLPQKALHTFSAVFDDLPVCDERRFIETLQGDFVSHYVKADRFSPLTDLDGMLRQQDEPFMNPILYMRRALFHEIRAQGTRVLLDGFVGDGVVSHGLAYLTELARSGRWWTLATELNSLSRYLRGTYQRPLWTLLLGKVLGPLTPDWIFRIWRRLRRRQDWDILLPLQLAQRSNLVGAEVPRAARTAREEHLRLHTSIGVYPDLLEIADREAISAGISLTYPFLDKRLVEYCLALPGSQKLKKGWSRWVFRRAMAGILPEPVRWRCDKSNLNPMLMRALLVFDRERVEAVLRDDLEVAAGYLDVGVLRRAWTGYRSHGGDQGDPPLTTMTDVLRVWRAVTLARWLRLTGVAV